MKVRRNRGVRLLCVILVVAFSACSEKVDSPSRSLEILPQVDSIVKQLLVRYNIDAKAQKFRKVPSNDKAFTRIERRVVVVSEFNVLNFNHDLSNKMSELGAQVVATEKSEDKTVTMHIKKDDIIIQSLVFVVKQNK